MTTKSGLIDPRLLIPGTRWRLKSGACVVIKAAIQEALGHAYVVNDDSDILYVDDFDRATPAMGDSRSYATYGDPATHNGLWVATVNADAAREVSRVLGLMAAEVRAGALKAEGWVAPEPAKRTEDWGYRRKGNVAWFTVCGAEVGNSRCWNDRGSQLCATDHVAPPHASEFCDLNAQLIDLAPGTPTALDAETPEQKREKDAIVATLMASHDKLYAERARVERLDSVRRRRAQQAHITEQTSGPVACRFGWRDDVEMTSPL